jgi:hypothetical protein
MDIYDGADWTEMDIDDLKAVESGCAIQTPPRPYAAPGRLMTSSGNAANLG